MSDDPLLAAKASAIRREFGLPASQNILEVIEAAELQLGRAEDTKADDSLHARLDGIVMQAGINLEVASAAAITTPAFGPTSSAIGPYPVGKFNAKHLCKGQTSFFISATIYYPKTTTTTSHELLPSIVLVGGFACGEHVLAAWAPFYASHGIVAMTIGMRAPFRNWPRHRSRALVDASAALQREHSRAGSPLEGRLDASRRAVQGYSLGGGGVQLAALADPALKCAIALAPHSGAPYDSFPHELTPTVPMLFLVGSHDMEAHSQIHSWPMYHRTRSPKLLFEISGGDHFVVNGPTGGRKKDIHSNNPLCFRCNLCCLICSGGKAAPCPCAELNGSSGHAQAEAPLGAIGGVALAWLKVFLDGDEAAKAQLVRAGSVVGGRPAIASGFEMQLDGGGYAAPEATAMAR